MSGYSQVGGLMGFGGAIEFDKKLKRLDTSITSKVEKATDGDNMEMVINHYVVMR